MRKSVLKRGAIAVALVIGLSFSFSSCLAGPHQLRRSVDDWEAKTYTNSPWIAALFNVVPVFPLAYFGAQIGDFFVTNGYHFWLKDAWDGKGTGFEHTNFLGTDGHMQSMLVGPGSWMKVEGGGGN